MRGIIAGVLVTAALTLALPGVAQTASGGAFYVTGTVPLSGGPYTIRRIAVDFGAADPSKPENAAATLDVLTKAAERVCATHSLRTNSQRAKEKKCQKKAVDQAIQALNVPELTRLASEK